METDRLNRIGQFYDLHAEKEWDRLFSDQFHQVEYRVTLHYLERFLRQPQRILDAGGGPGRYTIHLSGLGHRMTLIDISQNELDLAKTKIAEFEAGENIELVARADILDLSLFPDSVFDSTLALGGVLSHFVNEQDRKKALLELSRVTKSNGTIFISVMNRLGEIGNVLESLPAEVDSISQFLTDGNHKRLVTGESTGTHFFTPTELISLMEHNGLAVEVLASIQNLASPLREYVNKLPPQLFEKWLNVFVRLSQEPSLWGISNHLLVVARNSKGEAKLEK